MKMQMRIIEFMKRCFITQSLSCSPFDHPDMTEILLKGLTNLDLASPLDP